MKRLNKKLVAFALIGVLTSAHAMEIMAADVSENNIIVEDEIRVESATLAGDEDSANCIIADSDSDMSENMSGESSETDAVYADFDDEPDPVSAYRGKLSLGHVNTAVIKSDGTLWMWGYNSDGELGVSTKDYRQNKPIKVMSEVMSVSCSEHNTGAVKADGSLWVWGKNYNGELGTGTRDKVPAPVKIMDDVASVEMGYFHSAAIKTDGSLWMWGLNKGGAVGTGDEEDSYILIPTKVMDNVKKVALGSSTSVVLANDGRMYAWGTDIVVRNEKKYEPVYLCDGVKDISVGGQNVAFLKNDNSMWRFGSFKEGGILPYSEAKKIMENVKYISAGTGIDFAAVTYSDELYIWGYNGAGQIGDGTTEDRLEPVKVMDNVAICELGGIHSGAITNDGYLWLWGANYNGELGDGTLDNSTVPKKIMKITAGSEPDPKPDPVKPEPAVFVPTDGSGEATDPQPSVTDDTTALTLVKGQKFTLGNTDWKSDNAKVVSVSKANVTIKAATGDKPVTLSRGSGDNKQTISVTVLAPTIDKADKTITLVVGESKKLNLKNTGDLAVTYTSATPDVATVYSDGTVIGISKGSSAVTAYVNGVAFKFTVKVIDANTKVNFADETVTLVPNQTLAIKVPGFTASKASWTSDTKVDTDEKNIVYRDSVVKIDKSGKMTAIGVGSTSFTGTDSKSNSVNIKVSVSAPAEHVIHLNVNTSKALKLFGVKGNLVWGEYKEGEVEVPEVLTAATGNGSGIMEFGDKTVKYQSGKFTGLKAGMVTLKANDGNFDHILKIYVEDPSVKGLDGKPFNYSVNMKVGETKTFTIPGIYQDVTFISNKAGVAYACPADVDGSISYVISARSAGTAKLTAKVNGKAVNITVKVTK